MTQKLQKLVEKMVTEQDYNGARLKLLEMKRLFHSMAPQFDSMLLVCELLCAAKFRLAHDLDHYWILNASPLFSLSDITANYQRITNSINLVPHFPGAKFALHLLHSSFSVISDQRNRSLFDSTRKSSLRRSVASLDFELRLGQDYHGFDSERAICNVMEAQIWSVKLGDGYVYGRVTAVGDGVVWMTWLRPIPISGGERRWCDSGLPVSCGSFEVSQETSCELNWSDIASHRCVWERGIWEGRFEINPRRGEVWAIYGDWDMDEWAHYGKDILKECKYHLVEITSEFSKYSGVECVYLVKVDGFRFIYERDTSGASLHIRPGLFYMFSHRIASYRFVGGEIGEVVVGMVELDRFALNDSRIVSPLELDHDIELDLSPKLSFSVADFSSGQIWAVCCGEETMPRRYARVDQAVSESKVCVTLLEHVITIDAEMEQTSEKREKRPVVCGVFQVSTTSLCLGVSDFSYLVNCRRRIGTFFEINPRKGEVWAMYNNEYEYQIVQILSDFEEEEDGIRIVRLVEVKGCLTFFQRQQCDDGLCLNSLVSRKDVFSFSHRIPAFRVPGIGGYGVPESSWHLEPNALPPKRTQKF